MRTIESMFRLGRISSSLLVGALAGACDRQPPPPALSKAQPGERPTTATGDSPSTPTAESMAPTVTLSGQTTPGSVTWVAPGMPRIYAKSLRTWVREQPDRDSPKLGYLRAGGSAPVVADGIPGRGCKAGWAKILPRGFVCGGRWTTRDPSDPVVQAFIESPPDVSRKLPYIYGTVRKPGPTYLALPSAEQLRKAEPNVDERMQRWFDIGGEVGASYAQHVWTGGTNAPDPERIWNDRATSGVPSFLASGQMAPNLHQRPREEGTLVRGRMTAKVGHSFLQTFLWEGRRYGLSTELDILPTDRLRPIQGSDFHGFEIGKDVKFPFAIVRHPVAKYYDGSRAEYRAPLALTGKQRFYDGVLHYETRDGKYISDRYASRVKPASKLPGWATRGERWIDVSIAKQTLVLYEGPDPVYATLISSGEAGLADAESTTATAQGIFRIHTKHITATMSSREIGEEFELRDVPYVQYFAEGGYALHGAYWHDRFGMPKSHGCINLSPEDARRVFFFTEPRLPAGWHGALLPLRGTTLWVHP